MKNVSDQPCIMSFHHYIVIVIINIIIVAKCVCFF